MSSQTDAIMQAYSDLVSAASEMRLQAEQLERAALSLREQSNRTRKTAALLYQAANPPRPYTEEENNGPY